MPRQIADEAQTVPGLEVAWETGLEDHIVRASWSPDGSRLAAALTSGPVVVFDCTGRRLLDLPGHESGTLSLSWRADGRVLASGGQDSRARLWDAASGRLLHSLEGGKHWVEQVAFSPSGDLLVTASGRTVRLWSGSGELLRDYPPHPSTVADFQWQPTELFFATAAYGQLATFGPEVIEPAKRFAWKGLTLTIAWSPDGNYIATGNQDASVHFWYRKTGRELEMIGYPAQVRELSWDAGRLRIRSPPENPFAGFATLFHSREIQNQGGSNKTMNVRLFVLQAVVMMAPLFAQHHHGNHQVAGGGQAEQGIWPQLPIPAPLACHFKGVVSHSFYGKPSQILHEMRGIEDRLAGSATGRVYMAVIEAAGAAQVYYFERQQNGDVLRVSWQGDSAVGLRHQLETEILESRGRRCAGQQMREKVLALGGARSETLSLPELTKANHAALTLASLVSAQDQETYIRLTVFYPC
jgi:hypothetical protein